MSIASTCTQTRVRMAVFGDTVRFTRAPVPLRRIDFDLAPRPAPARLARGKADAHPFIPRGRKGPA